MLLHLIGTVQKRVHSPRWPVGVLVLFGEGCGERSKREKTTDASDRTPKNLSSIKGFEADHDTMQKTLEQNPETHDHAELNK